MSNEIEILKSIPKTEIHLHLEGLASIETLWYLISKHKLDIGINSKAELSERFRIHNLNEFVDLFVNVIQNCIRSEEDLEYFIHDAQNYLEENNVRYAEIFYSPTKLMQNGMKYANIVACLTQGAERIERENGAIIRYITDVSRSFGIKNARMNLNNHIQHSSDVFIGIGLGGAEQKQSAKGFRGIFKKAIRKGCRVVAHAGEDSGPASIWEVLKYLNIQRIGHGISAIQDKKLIAHLRESQIILEICPTSNLYIGKYAHSLSAHPIRYFFDEGLNITLNSDDPTPFNTSITEEYCKLLESGLFNMKELIRIIRNGIYGTFMSSKDKESLWKETKEYLSKNDAEHLIP